MTSVTYPNGTTTTYAYDDAGNRTERSNGAPPPPPPPPPPSPLEVSVSPSTLDGTGSGGTPPATATVAGGTPPYVYLWQKLSGSAYIYADNPTGATTRFRWSGSYSGPPKLSNWRCQVTDSASVVAYSDSIRVGIDPSA